MKVRDIMTREPVTINPEATLDKAAELMKKYNIGSIPVCSNNSILGILTDRDIVIRSVAYGGTPDKTTVKEVMTTQIETVTPELDISEVSEIMSQRQIRRLPVVENNKVVGMIAIGDLAVNHKADMEASEALTEISRPAKPSNPSGGANTAKK